jgi:hypothetical protein
VSERRKRRHEIAKRRNEIVKNVAVAARHFNITVEHELRRRTRLREYVAEKKANGEPCVPLNALLLGCSNCRQGDRARHPELGLVYCAVCPVTGPTRRGEMSTKEADQ